MATDPERNGVGEETALLSQVETTSTDPKVVSWNGEDDPENPRRWPNSVKRRIGFIITSIAILSLFFIE
jgi:hypothetical protein